MPKVSLIVPCYNYAEYLPQCLDSVLGQDFSDLEVIAINDASPDDTGNIMEAYRQRDARVQVINHPCNLGHIASYNEGIARASGRYLAILSPDDYCLDQHAISHQVEVFERNSSVGMVYTGHAIVSDGNVTQVVLPSPANSVSHGRDEFQRLVWGNYILHSGTFLRAEVQAALGLYDPSLPHTADWDLWLRASLDYDVGYVALPCYAYRMHGSNMRHKRISPAAAADESIRVLERAYSIMEERPISGLSRRATLDHALLQNAWFDLSLGLTSRVWRAIAHAVRRRPLIVLNSELGKLAVRALLVNLRGRARVST